MPDENGNSAEQGTGGFRFGSRDNMEQSGAMHRFPWLMTPGLSWLGACAAAVSLAAAQPAWQTVLETPHLAWRLDPATGRYMVEDRLGGVRWRSDPWAAEFGRAVLRVDGRRREVALAACRVETSGENGARLVFQPLADRREVRLAVQLKPRDRGRSVELGWALEGAAEVEEIRLLDRAFWGTADEQARLAAPVREGMLIPAQPGREFRHTFDTYAYEGCHMAMLGMLRAGAALLLSWDDPYVAAEVINRPGPGGQTVLAPSLVLRKSARRVRVTLVGRGDHVALAKAYRQVARERGWFVPWSEKLKENPGRSRLFGAINFKLWSLLDRRMSEDSRTELSVRVNWTFDEAARVAEHLRRDLGLEKVLFLMGGWIRRGYDNQHPDILPAAPECGGNEGLADCARRVRRLGFLLGLHDNYQDMYRDAPSWDPRYLMKRPDGSLAKGGHWAGGRAYLTCSRMAVELARRPQNLPAVFELTHADAYFIDTTYAAGLQECFDPEHPLTRADDMHWKQVLSDYARGLFGIFGSECGREWAIPHSDFFEGLAGVRGDFYHNRNLLAEVGGIPVPLFELVYHECIAIYGKYGYDPFEAAPYLLQHALYGRTLHHHNVPPHLYWQTSAPEDRLAVRPLPPEARPLGPDHFRFAWRWRVDRPPAGDWRVFVHFTDAAGTIRFQNDHEPATPTSRWQPGVVASGTFEVRVPPGTTGPVEVRVGLYQPASGTRARLAAPDDGERRVRLGRLIREGARWRFEPAPEPAATEPADRGCFVRGDGGWTEGLHPYDRFVKNAYEVLSPLNELTSLLPLTSHRFVTDDRTVQESVFGEGTAAVRVTVNFGPAPWTVKSARGGRVVLPAMGLLIEAPTFAAFHATEWNGRRYEAPVLFTIRSRDGRPLDAAERVRVYHGFGDPRLRLPGGREVEVAREAVVRVRSDGARE
ncbi:MAG: hypothetical protein D6766_01385 [Verrucomicrobia bacterium]|nr:MAG: hypothetical protein D6766_01385 [Verrucomicrobiota bacterium]